MGARHAQQFSVRAFVTTVRWGLELGGMNVDTAYLNTTLEEDIYTMIELPRDTHFADDGLDATALTCVRVLYRRRKQA